MASTAMKKFVTTIAFAQEIGRCVFSHYESEFGKERIKRLSLELKNTADDYLGEFKDCIDEDDVPKIAKLMDKMATGVLESASSYQAYLSFLVALISEREQELIEHNGSKEKIACLADLRERSETMWTYYSSRTRKDDYDVEGLILLGDFNVVFSG